MTSTEAASTPKPRSNGPPRPNYAQIHARALPFEVFPLPAFIPHNPISYLRLAYVYLIHIFTRATSHPPMQKLCASYYCEATRSVHVTESATVRILWEQGFFGKGSLSRSEPEWLEREKRRLGLVDRGQTSADVTRKRREERREEKRERARKEREELEEQLRREGKLSAIEARDDGQMNGVPPNGDLTQAYETRDGVLTLERMPTDLNADRDGQHDISRYKSGHNSRNSILANEEHLQLSPVEVFFLQYTLGVIRVHFSHDSSSMHTTDSLFELFRRTSVFPPLNPDQRIPPDDPFVVSYVVYHHFRSLGWVVRPGMKFAVDFLIYNRGPVFAHAEFAIIIIPSYADPWWQQNPESRLEIEKNQERDWWWLHAANRVQSQVRKSFLIVYVEIPPPEEVSISREGKESNVGQILRRYRVRQFCIKRWTANRSRD